MTDGAATDKPLTDLFHEHATGILDDDGFRLAPAIARAADGGVTIAAIDMAGGPRLVYGTAVKLFLEGNPEVIAGIDFFTRPGQGTTLDSVLACVVLRREQRPRYGIIEYEGPSRTVMPWNWNNIFWNQQMAMGLTNFILTLRRGEGGHADS